MAGRGTERKSMMKNSITFYFQWSGLLLVLLMSMSAADETMLPPVRIEPLRNLQQDLAEVRRSGRPLMLIFSADHCPFCERLKQNIVNPMLRSGDYDDRILIRITELDIYESVTGKNGQPIDPPDLARAYGVFVTPTVLLLGPDGEELAPRQLGINNEDFYGAYLDNAIAEAREKLKAGAPQGAPAKR